MAQEPTKPPRAQTRATATFTPYYWEAYNEIVEPRRFDHYLIRRWLPELGALGFAIVKALRDRCYHNPLQGVLRDECEVDMSELAAAMGVSRATLFREFERNKALMHFVQKQKQFQMRGGKPHQTANAYRVSMDEPVHPDDYERYDTLRAEKEKERQSPAVSGSGARIKPEKQVHCYESQIDTHRVNHTSYGSHIETPETMSLGSQSVTADATHLVPQIATAFDYLPSGGVLTKDVLTPAVPPTNPQGDKEVLRTDAEESEIPLIRDSIQESLLCGVWTAVLKHVQAEVNKPTFETHFRTLQLIALDNDAGTAQLIAQSQFTRQWIEGRYLPLLTEAFAAETGNPIQISVHTAPKNGVERDGLG